MASRDIDVQGDWTLIGEGGGQIIVTAYGKEGRVISTNTPDQPTFNRLLVGHILDDRRNVTFLLSEGEYLWLNGIGHFTITDGF